MKNKNYNNFNYFLDKTIEVLSFWMLYYIAFIK